MNEIKRKAILNEIEKKLENKENLSLNNPNILALLTQNVHCALCGDRNSLWRVKVLNTHGVLCAACILIQSKLKVQFDEMVRLHEYEPGFMASKLNRRQIEQQLEDETKREIGMCPHCFATNENSNIRCINCHRVMK